MKYKSNVKLTNSDIDNHILRKKINIIRIGNYVNAKTKLLFQCKICEYKFECLSKDICNGHTKCPKCNKKIKITNEIFDERIKDKCFIRTSDVKCYKIKVDLKCKACNYAWKGLPSNIFKNYGCPKCSKRARVTNEDIDNKIIHKNIVRIDDYVNCKTHINFKCLLCQRVWKSLPSVLIKSIGGCINCTPPLSKNEGRIKDFLIENNIKFEPQFPCKISNKKFKIDFYLTDFNTFVEYDGAQHFKPIRFGGMSEEDANVRFEKQIIRDTSLSKYCIDEKINLLRINGTKYFGRKLISILPTLFEKFI